MDNRSRESFIRTAYPQALAAADGDPVLAQQLLATAISENGKVGTGRSLGEMGNNVGGIQGVQGSAGSFTAMDAGRPRQFAAYNTLTEGFRAVRDLVSGGRYAQAAATYQQTKDIDRYWGDVNRAGYSETPDWQDRIANIRRTQVEPVTRGLNTTIPGPDQSPNGTPITAPAQQGRIAPSAGLDTQGIVKAYENTSYTYGGPGGRTQGFGAPTDCSGFVAAIYKNQYGLDLVPHTDGAYNQLRQAGAPEVSVKDARPGDVVFYMGAGTGGAITHHMGVYAGNGQVLDDSVSGQDGVRVRDVGHAGQYVILRDPRLNAQAPQTASTPPPIVQASVAEQSGGERLSQRQINAASQDAAGASPPPAAAPVTSASQSDPPQAALAEAPPSGQGGPPWTTSGSPTSSPSWMRGSQPTTSSDDQMLRQSLNQPTSGPDTVPGDPRVRVLAGQNPNEPRPVPMPGNVDDQATGANRLYSPPADSVPARGWIDRAVQQPDDRLPGYQRGDVTDAEGLDRTNDELYPVPGPAPGNLGTAPVEPDVMYRQPLGPTAGPDTFPTDASGSGVGASGSGPETSPYPASQAIPNEDATSYPRPSYVPPAEPLVEVPTTAPSTPQPGRFNPLEGIAPFNPLEGQTESAAPGEIPAPGHPSIAQITSTLRRSGEAGSILADQIDTATHGGVIDPHAVLAAGNALPYDIAAAATNEQMPEAEQQRTVGWKIPGLSDDMNEFLNPQHRPLNQVLLGTLLQTATPTEVAKFLYPEQTLALEGAGKALGVAARGVRAGIGMVGRGAEAVSTEIRAGSERAAAAEAQRAASGTAGQPAYGALGAPPEAPPYSPTAPEGFTRRYHGTASDFERANADKFDPNGLYGPGYYTTSDPRVAGSYAEANQMPFGPSAEVRRLRKEAARSRAFADFTPDPEKKVRALDEVQRYEQQIAEIEAKYQPSGANVRPLDVPNNLNLIDVDAPLDPDLLTRVRASVEKIAERRPDVAAEFQDELWGLQSDLKRRGADPSVPELNNDALVKVLMDAAERVGRVDDTVGGKALATEILQRSGYDGIAHTGGQRVPMLDGAGQPIEHDVTVVFPGAVSKVRNALAGTYGGARLGAPAASASDPLARATNVLGRGAMASIYGGAAGLTNQAMNPDDPNAFVKGALPAAALSAFGPQAARRALRAAGKVAPEAEGALAALGNVPRERQVRLPGIPEDPLRVSERPAVSTAEQPPARPSREALPEAIRTLNRRPEAAATPEQQLDLMERHRGTIGRISAAISDAVAPWAKRLNVVRYGSMLSDSASQVANAVPNTIMQGVDLAATPLAVGLDVGRAGLNRAMGKPADRQVFMSEIPARLVGMRTGAKMGLQMAADVLGKGLNPEEAAKLEQRSGFGTNIPLLAPAGSRRAGAVDLAMEAPMRALGAADAMFRTTSQGGHLMAEAVASATVKNGGKTPTDAMIREALKDPAILQRSDYLAKRSVVQEDRMLTDWYKHALHYQPDDPTAKLAADTIRAGVSLEVPFVKTPYNVVAQGMGMTPMGLLGVIQDVKQGKASREVEQRVARVMLGTGMMGVAAADYASGNLTGPYPDDAKEASTLPPGWRPWSQKVPLPNGETYYLPLSYLGPLALPPVVAILAGESVKQGNPLLSLETAGKIAAGVGHYAAQQTFLEGVAGAAKLMDSRESPANVQKQTEQIAAQFAPHIVGAGALGNEIQRVMGMPSRDPEGMIEAILATHPATAEQVEPKQDVLGRPASRGLGGPAGTAIRAGQENDAAVIRAFRSAGEGLPMAAPKSVRDPSANQLVALSPTQQHRWRQVFGVSLREKWSNQGNPTDAKQLRDIESQARADATATILGRR